MYLVRLDVVVVADDFNVGCGGVAGGVHFQDVLEWEIDAGVEVVVVAVAVSWVQGWGGWGAAGLSDGGGGVGDNSEGDSGELCSG